MAGATTRRGGPRGFQAADLVLGLASPGAFPCPEASPSYSVQFSKQAGDGHYLAFGTEVRSNCRCNTNWYNTVCSTT